MPKLAEPQWGDLSEQIRNEVLKASRESTTFSVSDVLQAAPKGASRELVDQVLSRMVRASEITRPERGVYSASSTSTPSKLGMETNGKLPLKPARTVSFIWSIAELLRGDVKPADYGSFVLPFTVLRRLDSVLEKTKAAVVAAKKGMRDLDNLRLDQKIALEKAAGYKFYNTSALTLTTVLDDPSHVRANLEGYIDGFSPNVRDIFERYKFDTRIAELDEKNLLYKVLKEFVAVDLHPNVVSNSEMGDAFENLIRRFAELSNETAGEHYTPRDAIRLAVDLLLAGDTDLLTNKAPLRSIYDPTAGTGGMLSVAEDRIKAYNTNAKVTAYAQELNDESYAVCKADMLIKGQNVNNVFQGNTLSVDKFSDKKFDWMLSNPPYGVDWKKIQEIVEDEHEKRGFKGRFGPGLPRISDGQTLFLLHLVSKMQPTDKNPSGSRIAIVMNGSPLFSGAAGSGESEIRKYLFENDLVEAIVGLPTEMFYNTGIATYIWILTNKKRRERRGKVQLLDATSFWKKMPKSLGNKRRFVDEDAIATVVRIYGEFKDSVFSKVLPNDTFGYRTIVVERPLRLNFQVTPERLTRLDAEKSLTKNDLKLQSLKDALIVIDPAKVFKSRPAFLKAFDAALKAAGISLAAPQYKVVWQALSERDESAELCLGPKGKPEADSELRDTENVPLSEDITAYFEREVKPYVGDAWIDREKTRVGYEVPFTQYFYRYVSPRTLGTIDADLAAITDEIVKMLRKVTA